MSTGIFGLRPILSVFLFSVMIIFTQGCPSGKIELQSVLPEPPEGYVWKLIPEVSDEFQGDTLDTDKWLDYHPYWKGREPSHHAPENISVEEGYLLMKNTTMVDDTSEVENPRKDVWVKAACLSTKAPICSYGYYETRMQASDLSMTSSFWFQGKYSEIDVVEQLGRPLNHPERSKLMLINTHYKAGTPEYDKTPVQVPMESGSADEFHIYAMWWKDKNTIWFYHNGEKVAEVTTKDFLEPMYMFFDTEVFTWEGLPTVESLKDDTKNTMKVDWVRGWKLEKQ